MYPLFATGVIDTAVANLPPVSTTLAKLVEKFAAGVADTGGKFAAGVVVTGSNFAASVVDTVANLPPVSLILVVHLDLRLFPRIFEKIRNGPNAILWGWGETDSSKKTRSKKSRDTVPFKTFL